MATPDGEPHGKETHRLADTFSSSARGEYVNFQLVQEVCVRECVCVCVWLHSTYGMGSVIGDHLCKARENAYSVSNTPQASQLLWG